MWYKTALYLFLLETLCYRNKKYFFVFIQECCILVNIVKNDLFRQIMCDENISSYVMLPSPKEMMSTIYVPANVQQQIIEYRQTIRNILDGIDKRLLLIIGPCSIHDPRAAFAYAQKLSTWAKEHNDTVFVVMRTYFEKPRTIMGWKGLLYDPDMNDSYDITKGIVTVRACLLQINGVYNLPCACEFLDPNMPQYYADLISWGAIGARTTESQVHRQMASGLSCPIGFKNSTSGSVKYPIDSIKSCAYKHIFPGINYDGRACVIKTKGNPYCHIILRGSDHGPNYNDVDDVSRLLDEAGLPKHRIMVDCAHGNSDKCHIKQKEVWRSVIDNRSPNLVGIMIESFLEEGNCSIELSKNKFGCSITDKCIGWDDTLELLNYTVSKS
jgi:3-deoxy-7-phosphoheptulonate synthase